MGQTTPNMGIYIPSAGETNYEQSFAAGMMNIDQHDHSGGPNKGVPITNSGLADFSVTYDKLNSNVVDPTTGIGTQGGSFQNRLQLLGYLANLYQLSLGPGVGFVAMNGGVSAARTFQDTASITWTNASGGGDPSAVVVGSGITGIVPVDHGGTGVNTLIPYAPILAGTTATGPVQQPAVGSAGDVLTSQGAGMPSVFASPGSLGQIQYVTMTLTAAQVKTLNASPIQMVAAPGAGKVLVPVFCYGLLTSSGTAFVGSFPNPTVSIAYTSTPPAAMSFSANAFLVVTADVYSWSTQSTLATNGGLPKANVQNKPLLLKNFGNEYTGGGTSTITFNLAYVTITL